MPATSTPSGRSVPRPNLRSLAVRGASDTLRPADLQNARAGRSQSRARSFAALATTASFAARPPHRASAGRAPPGDPARDRRAPGALLDARHRRADMPAERASRRDFETAPEWRLSRPPPSSAFRPALAPGHAASPGGAALRRAPSSRRGCRASRRYCLIVAKRAEGEGEVPVLEAAPPARAGSTRGRGPASPPRASFPNTTCARSQVSGHISAKGRPRASGWPALTTER